MKLVNIYEIPYFAVVFQKKRKFAELPNMNFENKLQIFRKKRKKQDKKTCWYILSVKTMLI